MAKKNLRLAIAQINCTVGDLEGNSRKITDRIKEAQDEGADIITFPELAVTGYPPEDLLLKPAFVDDNLTRIKKIAGKIKDIVAIVGFVDRKGKDIYNAAAVIYKGRIRGVYHKMFLPNYGVFDEKRYFSSGERLHVFKYGKIIFGVNVCEDIWHKDGPTHKQARQGAGIIFNINASPYHAGKIKEREAAICRQARANRLVICYNNLIGGQDELVFDGQSMIVDARGRVIARAEAFKEDLLIADVELPLSSSRAGKGVINITPGPEEKKKPPLTKRHTAVLKPVAEIYQALTLGLRDYMIKNGFKKAVVGLSGGIDSCLVAAIAADALGEDNVVGVFLPSRYSSRASQEDARALAGNLNIKFSVIPIEGIFEAYMKTLAVEFCGVKTDITEENLQARIRGTLLMALSNKFGWIVLATGNKSEMSTGYATLYGDMAGGFAVIKDVPKTLVYELSRYRNSLAPVIPQRAITREPTAELRPNQKDSDSLPPYKLLDPILKAYIEEDRSLKKIVSSGFGRTIAERTLRMVDRNEYKRRQSPPGIKITPRAFGRDRRMPITNKYKA